MGNKRGRPSTKIKKSIRVSDKFVVDFINGLKESDIVNVEGIGDFVVREMKQRYYFNPSTGKQKRVPRRIKIVFEASEELKSLWKN